MKFELPEDIASLTLDELNALRTQIAEAYNELREVPDDKRDADYATALIELSTSLKTVRAQITATTEAEAQAAADIEAAVAELEAPDEEPAAEEPTDEPVDEPVDEKELETVTAAATTRARAGAVARAAAKAKPAVAPVEDEITEPARPKMQIVVAPDVRGFSAGQEVDGIRGLSSAFYARGRMFDGPSTPRRRGTDGVTHSFGVATMVRPRPEGELQITEADTEQSASAKFLSVAEESRKLRGPEGVDALVAAVTDGWVTPSENYYDLCAWETVSGGFTLPHITVNRGGLNFTKGIDFSTIFTNANLYFEYTEAQMKTNPTKPFLEISEPTWQDLRLGVIGYGVKLPIPLAKSFPELEDRYLSGALVGYQKKRNASVINKVLAYLGNAIGFQELGSAASDLLQVLEVARLQFIQKYQLADNAVLEVVFPRWIRAAIRADLSRRNGYANPFDVTDAQIDGWFRARGVRVQYIQDWVGQDLTGTFTQASLTLPATVQFMMYVPGTFVEGGDDIISLDTIYDQANLEKNKYIAAFFEESLLVANTCGQGQLFEVGLDLFGLSGAAVIGDPVTTGS